jgi:hypothetical protein
MKTNPLQDILDVIANKVVFKKELTDTDINLIAIKHMEVEGGLKEGIVSFAREIIEETRKNDRS